MDHAPLGPLARQLLEHTILIDPHPRATAQALSSKHAAPAKRRLQPVRTISGHCTDESVPVSLRSKLPGKPC
jgi:hypothetical protein